MVVSLPSAGGSICVRLLLLAHFPQLAVRMPKIPLDPFRACIFSAHGATEWAYRSQVAVAGIYFQYVSKTFRKLSNPTDLVSFICIVILVLKLKAGFGQSRLTRLMRTILQDGVLYFFVMAAFHIAMVFFAFFVRSPSTCRQTHPDDFGILQAFRSKFRASCDYRVRIPTFLLDPVINSYPPVWYL